MTKVTINLPTSIAIALGKASGKRAAVETSRLPANVIEAIFTAGAKVILTNVFNGGGKDLPQAEREAAVQKKLDAWYRGEFNIVARGDSNMTALKQAYIDDIRAKTEHTVAEVEKSIKDTVTSTFGEKESATFGRFIDAMGLAIAKEASTDGKPSDEEVASARDAFEAYYQGLADEAAAKRNAVAAKVDVTSIALAMFKKA